MIFDEGDIRLDFSKAVSARRLLEKGAMKPECMSFVDFVVDDGFQTLLIEVKDPSNPNAPQREIDSFESKIRKRTLVAEVLAPKARDSYTFEHLMKRDQKPFVFVLLIGSERLAADDAVMSGLERDLLERLRKETDVEWVRQYVQDCVVVTTANWNRVFQEYPMTRISAT
jgi:hypothetical protein